LVAAAPARLSAVPAELAGATIRAAGRLAGGQATAQVTSWTVAHLVQRVLWSITMIRLCKVIASVGVLSLVVGAGLWAQQPREQRARPRLGPQPERVAPEKSKGAAPSSYSPAHVVEPPDVLLVEVLDALPGRPISGERLVRPDGTISLGFYGDVYVAGLTLPEVKEKIIRQLQQSLADELLGLIDGSDKPVEPKDSALVFVDVTAYNSKNYYVQGDVALPGRLPVTGGDTVLDVIQYAGGLLPTADTTGIRLIRSYPKGSPVQVLPINYEEISMGTDSSTNYQILPGDRLVVPRNKQLTTTALPAQPHQQGNLSQSKPESPYFPGLNTDAAGKERESLRSVERRLSEVEKKLDRLIDRLERATRRAAPRKQQSPGAETRRGATDEASRFGNDEGPRRPDSE
jgi:protein involved in polysaccharide export with SLBB domain